MNSFLKDLALQHQIHEGWAVGTVSYRNNNPGNLRAPNGNFIYYPSYNVGLYALEGDLSAKIENKSKAMDRYYVAHNITYSQATFQDYVNVYAPSGDNNNPINYCNALCANLSQYNIKPTTSLYDLARLIYGVIDRIPDEMPAMGTPEANVRG
jgi:hypothetical protein